jgi:hypothetical protein
MHRPNPLPRRCTEKHGHAATFARGRVILTTAHLCHCQPLCAIHSHLLATCPRCHLRIDRKLHAAHRKQTLARRKKELLTSTPERATITTRPTPT